MTTTSVAGNATSTTPARAATASNKNASYKRNSSPLKRKRVAAPETSKSIKGSRKVKSATIPKQIPIPTTVSPACAPPPTQILLIDNGGNTLKYGLFSPNDGDKNSQSASLEPSSILNVTAQIKHQWTVLVGDEVRTVHPNQIQTMMRSTERACITNMGNQVQVWKAVLDELRIHVPLHVTQTTTVQNNNNNNNNKTAAQNSSNINMTAAEAFGWKVSKQPKEKTLHSPSTMAVVILISAPLCPRTIMEQILKVWFHDFGFAHVGILTSQVFGSYCSHPSNKSLMTANNTECCTVVDLGWSASQVIPTYQHKILQQGIRRMSLGSRHLVGLWKYYCSYRQWNLMDADLIMEDVHQSLAYVSLEFKEELEKARKTIPGKRSFDREYVLPDYQTTHKGFVRMTPWLIKLEKDNKKQQQQHLARHEIDQEKHDIEIHQGNETLEEETDKESNDDDDKEDLDQEDQGAVGSDDTDNDVDSEDETDDQRRARLLRQKSQEEQRQKELEAEHQALLVSVERFTIPEVLFHPSDAQLGNFAGLPQTICAAIEACPRIYQSALFGNIRLIGGMSKIPNLRDRLEQELRTLVPTHYPVDIQVAEDPIQEPWKNAKTWLQQTPYTQWSVSRAEYDSKGALNRLLDNLVGKLV